MREYLRISSEDIREWWTERICHRLCEAESFAVFSLADAIERIQVYKGSWVELKRLLRVFYFKTLKRGVVEAVDDLPIGASIQVRDIEEGVYVDTEGIDVGGGGAFGEHVWMQTKVEILVDQLTASSTRTLLPKAADAQYGEAPGYCAIFELLYALEPEGFEVIEKYRDLEQAPMGRPFRGEYIGYCVSKEGNYSPGDTIDAQTTWIFGRSMDLMKAIDSYRAAEFPQHPSIMRPHVFVNKVIAREKQQEIGGGHVYAVRVKGKICKYDSDLLQYAMENGFDMENWELHDVLEEYFNGADYLSGEIEAVVDGTVTVMGRLE